MATKKATEQPNTESWETAKTSEVTHDASDLGLSATAKARQERLAKTVGDASEFPHDVNYGDARPKHGEALADNATREG